MESESETESKLEIDTTLIPENTMSQLNVAFDEI